VKRTIITSVKYRTTHEQRQKWKLGTLVTREKDNIPLVHKWTSSSPEEGQMISSLFIIDHWLSLIPDLTIAIETELISPTLQGKRTIISKRQIRNNA